LTDINIPLGVSYRMNATAFRMSAERLANELELDDTGRPINLIAVPVYFLVSHSVELFLKAALLKRGFPEETLKKYSYRHNLAALMKEIQEKKVPISKDTIFVVERLSDQHQAHLLRYASFFGEGQNIYWPPFDVIFTALDELLSLTRISTHGV
jgi:hypothetical protein